MASTPPEPVNRLTIEQLSAETGLSVRNIRSHRTAGILPPPEVRDGLGWYGPDHVARLAVIRDLQAEGFNLKGIKRLPDQVGGPGGGALRGRPAGGVARRPPRAARAAGERAGGGRHARRAGGAPRRARHARGPAARAR